MYMGAREEGARATKKIPHASAFEQKMNGLTRESVQIEFQRMENTCSLNYIRMACASAMGVDESRTRGGRVAS